MIERSASSSGGAPPPLFRSTRAEISEAAIRANVQRFRRMLTDGCKLMAVVKADGYGHGMVRVARLALEEGADMIGVAIPEEAVELRHAGFDAPILVMGHTPSTAVETAVRLGISLTVFTEEAVEEIAAVCVRLQLQAHIHIKINTGMSRLGIAAEEEATLLAELALRSGWIKLEGAFTHFACATEADPSMTEAQFERYMSMVAALEGAHGIIPLKHCCNTAATLKFPHMHLNMVRVGIGLYGLNPLEHPYPEGEALVPAMTLKTAIVHIVELPINESVSYGAAFRSERESRIAVLPIGYADGIPRGLSNRGYAIVHGKRVPIVGRVCMDQTMLDVTDVTEAAAGMEVVLIGTSPNGVSITADEQANAADTIHYEIVTRIGKRVPKMWIR